LLALFVAEVSAEAGAVIADEGGDALAKRSLEEAWMWGKRGEAARADACLDAAEAAMESGGPINARHSVAVKLMRGHFAEKRGKFEEARRFFDAAEASLTADVPDEVRFLVLEERLRWLHVHGELREASLAADELLTLAELRRDPERISRYSEDSGMILFKLRNLNGAEARASRALEAATEANLQVEIGKAKKLQGAIANQRRDFDLALRLYREALSIFNGLGENHQIANCHYHIATVATEKNDRAAARIHIDEAVAFFTDAGALRGVGLCRNARRSELS
jgi:tetratricopeptide (TPR) repeat protein